MSLHHLNSVYMIDNEENNTKLDSNALEKHQLNLHCYRIIYISTNRIETNHDASSDDKCNQCGPHPQQFDSTIQ